MEEPRVTLAELQSVYSVEDLYNLLEVGAVRAHNERLVARRRAERERAEQASRGI